MYYISYTCSQSNSDDSIRVRLATSICYDTLMKNCFKDWSQSKQVLNACYIQRKVLYAMFCDEVVAIYS